VLAEFHTNRFYAYDLYDIFEQNTLLIRNYQNSVFYKKHRDFLEYAMIIFILLFFLPRVFLSYKERKSRNIALQQAESWLAKNLPKFKDNKTLNNKKGNRVYLSKESIGYIKKFKFSPRYINKFIKSKGFENL
jgi:preprotein translocase subunit SecG